MSEDRIIRTITCPMCGSQLPIAITQGVTGQVYATTADLHRCPVADEQTTLVAA